MPVTPRTLFLVDGIGALVTALVVGVVLPAFDEYFTMPRPVLHALALTAAVFAAYSLTCAAMRPKRWPGFLRAVAVANAIYCVVTAGCLIYFRVHLSMGDWIYFVGELAVLWALVTLELRVAREATTGHGAPTW